MVTLRSRLPATTGRLFSRSHDGPASGASRVRTSTPRVHRGHEAVLVLGIGSAVLGLLVAIWPDKTVHSLEMLLGAGIALGAGVQIYLAIAARFATPLRAVLALCGMLTAALALFNVVGGNSIPLLSIWLGASWAIGGVGQATVSVWDDRLAEPVRHELTGVATMLVGILVLLFPPQSPTALGFLAAAGLVLLGAANLALAGVGSSAVHVAWTQRIPVSHT
ncbi:DUF308 domain-containing protein [Nocardia noduli]|uniref:DUF308 domain-containing protein n=1 Tax=Nocardia noduli TaxID=2815722 RepID=UPI001C24F4D7|nr:DUF308 domain-containing protein [Nocardia noduli]